MKISVVIPVFNRKNTLIRSIESVFNQTRLPDEVVLVDDGSTDGSRELIQQLVAQDSRIKAVFTVKNLGGGGARNLGVAEATGDLIAFLDSDDEWLPEKLEKQIPYFENGDAEIGVVYSKEWIKDGEAPHIKPPHAHSGYIFELLLQANCIDTPTAVVRRSFFEVVGGFDPQMPRFQDWDLFLRLSRHCKIIAVQEPLILSYVTPGSISHNDKARLSALLHMQEKYADDISKNPVAQQIFALKTANAYFLNDQRSLAVKSFFNILRRNPGSVKAFAGLLISMMPQSLYRWVYRFR